MGVNMHGKIFLVLALGGTLSWAQPNGRRAAITGGRPDGGRCVVEVMVDGAATVEVRGDNGVLRDVSGAEPQWRRFDCTSPMPPDANVRFTATSGRGRAEMIRDPRNGGAAVVRIEDPENGAGVYSFELVWGREGREGIGSPVGGPPGRYEDRDAYYRDREQEFRGDWHARLFERVRDDLEHVQTVAFPPDRDEFRLAQTMRDLSELQASWRSGNYEPRRLDMVIDALSRVVADNRLTGREHDILADDMARLRDFRDHRGWRQ